MKSLLLISMPFKIGVGGFIRSWHVLPKLAKYLAEEGYEVELYIPANAIRTLAIYYQSYAKQKHTKSENLYAIVLREIHELEKLSNYSFYINEKVLEKNIYYNLNLLKSENESKLTKIIKLMIDENTRGSLIYYLEKKFLKSINKSIEKPHYAYSMHETVDAIAALQHLSKSAKSAILLQSDLGKSTLSRLFNIRQFKKLRGALRGLLAVSPAPIIETPELMKITNHIRVLVPGVAVDDYLLEYIKNNFTDKKWNNAVIYFGRISREKGIFDLLRAWKIVEQKTDAILYIVGKFEDSSSELKVKSMMSKLKRVVYLGVLNRSELFPIVSRCAVLAYPSHRDAFSLTVLEALFMRLKIVAYEIPALKYISMSENVKLVTPGDITRFAHSIINALEKDFKTDTGTLKILKVFSSWDRVALEEFRALKEIFPQS